MTDHFANIRDHFLAAMERDGLDAQLRYAAEQCSHTPELRAAVEAMLHAHHRTDGFLASTADMTTVAIEAVGTRIGPYTLLQEVGQGGMGVVYMAEQTEPVRRKVALKIIKPGMDTRQVIARFEAERQVLSLMDHPNIARALDAGTTDSGRPYFVMELVKGRPITEYCDERHLTPRQRLEMLMPVCHAIQHAHQKGIIHRDIKPSNILVAEYDQQTVPKVIDFGVAKAINQTLTERTMFTGYGLVIGTLEYMSPEQSKVNQLDVDTRSDVYSLGVLMYELLTGTTPFDKQRLRSAAWDEMLRIIREEEPPKPSTRLSELRDSLQKVSAERQTEPAKLAKLVRGELDWIVMKALEKDRNRRYSTVAELAGDIQRHLSDEPVQACPPSLRYRSQKFVRRHLPALTMIFLAGAALIVTSVSLALTNYWVTTERDRTAAALRAKDEALQMETAALAEVDLGKRLARHALYNAHMTLIDQSFHDGQIGRALELLEWQRPLPGQEDLRGFEWYHMWRLCNGGHHRTLRGLEKSVRCVAVSPDGKVLAAGAEDGCVRVWATRSGQEMTTLRGHTHSVNAVAFSPNGKSLLSAGSDGRVIVWDASNGGLIATLQGTTNRILTLAFSPDGRTLAAAGDADHVYFWDVEAWKPSRGISRRENTTTGSLAFSADGETLAIASGYRQLQLWDIPNDRVRATLDGHRWFARRVAFAADGKQLASASSDELEIKLWDAASGMLLRTLPGHKKRVYCLDFSPDSALLASGSLDGTVKVWELSTGRVRTFGHLGPVWAVDFLPNSRELASAGDDKTVKIWDVTVDQGRQQLKGGKGAVWSLAFSPDGRLLAAAHGDATAVTVWDVTLRKPRMELQGHRKNPTCVAFSPNGMLLASGGNDHSAILFEVATGKVCATLLGHEGNVHALAFSPTGEMLASSGNDGRIKLWDTSDGRERGTLEVPMVADLNSKWTYSLAFSPDGRTLAAASRDGVIRLWNAETRQVRGSLQAHCGNQDSLAFSPDGAILAALNTEARVVQFWDATTGSIRTSIRRQSNFRGVSRLAVTRDWKTLAIGGAEGVTLWDVSSGRERATLQSAEDEVKVLAFSSDGRLLATGGWNGDIALWETANEQDVRLQSSSEDPATDHKSGVLQVTDPQNQD